MKKNIFLFAGPVAFLVLLSLPDIGGMSPSAQAALASTAWIAIWWVTEAIPIPVTSLLPLVLYPLTGVMTIRESAVPYSNPLNLYFRGRVHPGPGHGTVEPSPSDCTQHYPNCWDQHAAVGAGFYPGHRFSLHVDFQHGYYGNDAAYCPIHCHAVQRFSIKISQANTWRGCISLALILALPYAASIGGMATLVGTPTNLIFIDSVERIYNTSNPLCGVDGIGISDCSNPALCLLVALTRNAFKLSNEVVPGSKEIIHVELEALGPMKKEEKWVMYVFGAVAFCWITRSYIISPFFPQLNDTIIVLIGAGLLFIIPSSESDKKLMDWETALKLPWGVLLLFGGAFSVAAAFAESGLTAWIGDQLSLLGTIPFIVALFIIVTVVNYLTEITQNMATCTLMMPIMAALAGVIGVHPYPLMVATCIASSCAFMLPVATAPNAVVFGSGYIRMRDMVRAGFMLNILSIIVIVVLVYLLMPLVWGIDMMSFPENLK